jgi:hypothetical protein
METRSRPAIAAFIASAVLMLLVGWSVATQAAQEEPPRLPDEYGALDAWISGEIVEMDSSRGRLVLAPLRELRQRSARSADAFDREPPVALIELRYAKGWVYFDDPEGPGQLRVTLKEGRDRLRVGQFIEIGRSTEFRGGYESSSVQVNGPMGTVVTSTQWTFKGWLLIRVTPFRDPE